MSAHRLTLHNVLRNGRHYALFHQAPVQAQNEPHNDEQTESGRFVEAVLPYVNLVNHRVHSSDSTFFNVAFTPPTWPISTAIFDKDAKLHHRFSDIYNQAASFNLPQKSSTSEASVQTDHSGEVDSTNKNLEKTQLEIENQIGVELMKGGFSNEAVKHFLHASENGHIEAMNNLADCLYHGNGAKENKREAWRLWKEAASLGHIVAMYNLAACYIGGKGTLINEDEGLKWMWMSANSGNADASFYLTLKLIGEGKAKKARRLIKYALRDSDYNTEMHSWIRDKVLDQECLTVLREELGLE